MTEYGEYEATNVGGPTHRVDPCASTVSPAPSSGPNLSNRSRAASIFPFVTDGSC